jgi:hypothetical protein
MKAQEIRRPPGDRQEHQVIDHHETLKELAVALQHS